MRKSKPKDRDLHDKYFLLAKEEGYVARSAYKLKQIQELYAVLRPGDAVLDLGCAPGSWLQVASELVGPHGLVVGIDLLPVKLEGRMMPANARAMIGDAFTVSPRDLLTAMGRPGLFGVVLSDMAPNTAGRGDDLRSVALCRRVLEIARDALAPGGRLIMKVLEGEQYPALMREMLGVFDFARGYRPDATREISREIFAVGMRFRGAANIIRDPAAAGAVSAARNASEALPTESGWSGLAAAVPRIPPHKRAATAEPQTGTGPDTRRFKPAAKNPSGPPRGKNGKTIRPPALGKKPTRPRGAR
ncbi:hypothetical protein BH11PLA1_BH11PLA1_10290 [soil metagenome]